MMVPDHASPCAWGTASPSSWPQSTAELHVRGALNRLDPPCLTSVGPKHGEQIALGVGEATFCRADARTTRQDSTLDPQLAGVLRDRPVERDLDLEARVAFAGLEGGMDRASHGGVEQGRCVAAVDRANRVVEALFGRGSEDNPTDLDL